MRSRSFLALISCFRENLKYPPKSSRDLLDNAEGKVPEGTVARSLQLNLL